jgi:hypothetical protein
MVAFEKLVVLAIAFELPQVRAPLGMVVPVPAEPNVGVTVVVLEALSLAQYIAVIVHDFPVSFVQPMSATASSPELRAFEVPVPPQTSVHWRIDGEVLEPKAPVVAAFVTKPAVVSVLI